MINPDGTKSLRILSLGAGVQSSTLALMMTRGEIEPADHAIFADTQWEPKAVYDWLDWLEKRLPFPVYRVSTGSLLEAIKTSKNSTGQRFASIPWFTSGGGMGRRQCTREYKIDPIKRKMRELLGTRSRQKLVEVVIGISRDEAQRMKPSRNQWQVHTWPLIELNISRLECLDWMKTNGYPVPPKSSCLGCPYHSDTQWAEIKKNKEEWMEIVEIDKLIRQARGIRNEQFMHKSLLPIDEVKLKPKERGIDLFGNECEGLCGV